jgi:hypothetical protein
MLVVGMVVITVTSRADLPDCPGWYAYTPPDHPCVVSTGELCFKKSVEDCGGSHALGVPAGNVNFACREQVIPPTGGKKTSSCVLSMKTETIQTPGGPINIQVPDTILCNLEMRCVLNKSHTHCIDLEPAIRHESARFITDSTFCREVVVPGGGG